MRNLVTKRLMISAAAATMLFGSAITANAAQEDLFDADYYAETYPDVAAAVGNDENALLQHYLAYGITEGRNANAYFNTLAYRNAYADLDAAFGDDWDAYADHYVAFGVSEGRNAGGERAITDEEYAAALAESTSTTEDIAQVAEETATDENTVNAVLGDDVHFYINGVKITLNETENALDVISNALGRSWEEVFVCDGYDYPDDSDYETAGFYACVSLNEDWDVDYENAFVYMMLDTEGGGMMERTYGKVHYFWLKVTDEAVDWCNSVGLTFDFPCTTSTTAADILALLGSADESGITSDGTANYMAYYAGGGYYDFFTDLETGELISFKFQEQ